MTLHYGDSPFMQSGDNNNHNRAPLTWPPKEVIESHLFDSSPVSMVVLSTVSKEWNNFFKDKSFWQYILVRDFGFDLKTIEPLNHIELKKTYIRLSSLEKNNPSFAKWYRKNIIETRSDFSTLYATYKPIAPSEWLALDDEFNLALKVSNLELAKQLMFIMFINDQDPDEDTLKAMLQFGNLAAVNWLINTAHVRPKGITFLDESDSDSDDDIDATYEIINRSNSTELSEMEEPDNLSEFSELLALQNTPEQNEHEESKEDDSEAGLLLDALTSPSLTLIKAEIERASPRQILNTCISILEEDNDTDVIGLRMHGSEIAKQLIASALQAMAGKSLHAIRDILYPIAAFSGKIETFTWLEEELAKHPIEKNVAADEPFDPGPTLYTAIASGKVDLVKWLIDPDGGKLDASDTDVFDSINIDVALRSKNPDMVRWYIHEKQANIKIETEEDLFNMMKSIIRWPELVIILESMLESIKNRTLPSLTDEQLKEILYSAARYDNVSVVTCLLDSTNPPLELTSANKAKLLQCALQATSVPLLSALTAPERGENKIVLEPALLSTVIQQLHHVTDEQNNLPALVHWLTDKEHGNLPVRDNLTRLATISAHSQTTKTLIEGILQRADAAEKQLIESNAKQKQQPT
jgi:hypothetical protein